MVKGTNEIFPARWQRLVDTNCGWSLFEPRPAIFGSNENSANEPLVRLKRLRYLATGQ